MFYKKFYYKLYTMYLNIRCFFKFLYKKFKRIFSKEAIAVYVCRTGNDNNSGFNRKKPKLTITSALDLIIDYPLTKKNLFKIVSLFQPRKKLMKIVLIVDNKGMEKELDKWDIIL